MKKIFKSYPGLQEICLFLVVLLIYQATRALAIGDASVAFQNAYRIVSFEKFLGIFTEIEFQKWFLNYPNLIKWLNSFYVRAHLPTTILFFVWLYKTKINNYYNLRDVFIFSNLISLLFYIFYPCAPPRMLSELGFIDTLLSVSKINLYQGALSKTFNQYAAVPSMHFGYSLFIGYVFGKYKNGVFPKMLGISYPAIVLTVIVATANHFWLDAIIGGLIVFCAYLLVYKLNLKINFKFLNSYKYRNSSIKR